MERMAEIRRNHRTALTALRMVLDSPLALRMQRERLIMGAIEDIEAAQKLLGEEK